MSDDEPAYYVWTCDNKTAVGTLRRYARMWENSYYSGDAQPALQVSTWGKWVKSVEHEVQIVRGELTENDYIPYEISVNGESVTVRIDGRS